jgi:hypothetical protein
MDWNPRPPGFLYNARWRQVRLVRYRRTPTRRIITKIAGRKGRRVPYACVVQVGFFGYAYAFLQFILTLSFH